MDSMKSSEGKYREGAPGQRPCDINIWKLGIGGDGHRKGNQEGVASIRKEKNQKDPRGHVNEVAQAQALSHVPQRSDSKIRTANWTMVGKMEFYQDKREVEEVEFCCEGKAETREMESVVR